MVDLAKLVVRLEAETARYASELDKAKRQLGGLSEEAQKAIKAQEDLQDQMDRAAKVFASTRSPMERYEEELAGLQKLLQASAIDQTTFNRAVSAAQETLDKTNSSIAEGKAVFDATRTPLEKYNSELERLDSLLKQGAIDQDTFNRATAAAQADLAKTNALVAEGRSVFEATRTPMERYNAEVSNLQKLLKAGTIDQTTFNRAIGAAKKDLSAAEIALKASNKQRQQFISLAKAAGVAALGFATAIGVMVKHSIDAADRMGKLSQETGIATKDISELGYAASFSNIGTEELAKSLQKLATTAVDGAKAGSAQAKAFADLGVSVKDSSGNIRATDQILLDVADRFANLEDGARKASLAQDLFGKSGAKLIPFLNQGRAGIEALRAEAQRLGISLTDEAARAAGEFNDNMTRLQAVSAGLGRELASKLLPYLIDLTETLLDVARDGEALQDAVDGLVVVFKTFATVGIAANAVFQTVGKSIGAVIAAAQELDFRNIDLSSPVGILKTIAMNADGAGRAVNILKDGFDDIGGAVEANVNRITDLWTDADNKLREVTVTAQRLKGTLGDIGGGDIVKEIDIKTKKIEQSPVSQLMDEFNEATKTSTDLAQEQYNREKEMLEVLLREKIISVDEYNERISESFDKFIPQFDVTVEKIKEKTKKATDDLNEFQKEAARNTQGIIAEGLETALDDGAKKGADAVLEAFGNMIEKMILQAAAANIAKYLFGEPGKEGDTGGVLTQLASSFFGGTRDSGGSGRKGKAYKIGTGAQPEWFVPQESGHFYPANQMAMAGAGGGGANVTQNIYTQGPMTQRSSRQLLIEAQRQQRIATSRLG